MKSFKLFYEEFITAGDGYSGYGEIYINPTTKEAKEIGTTYHVIIDSIDKKIYVTNENLFHKDMVKFLHMENQLVELNYNKYWMFGEGIDRYITMTFEPTTYYTESLGDILLKFRGKDKEQEIKDNINKLLNSNYSWLSKMKWIDINKFKAGLDEIREML